MKDYLTVLDVWEGSLEINEQALVAGGIAGLTVRINDTIGGLHRDSGFDKQWSEASPFVRAPYFVYNPWAKAYDNSIWLEANMPIGCPCVFPGRKVRRSSRY